MSLTQFLSSYNEVFKISAFYHAYFPWIITVLSIITFTAVFTYLKVIKKEQLSVAWISSGISAFLCTLFVSLISLSQSFAPSPAALHAYINNPSAYSLTLQEQPHLLFIEVSHNPTPLIGTNLVKPASKAFAINVDDWEQLYMRLQKDSVLNKETIDQQFAALK